MTQTDRQTETDRTDRQTRYRNRDRPVRETQREHGDVEREQVQDQRERETCCSFNAYCTRQKPPAGYLFGKQVRGEVTSAIVRCAGGVFLGKWTLLTW